MVRYSKSLFFVAFLGIEIEVSPQQVDVLGWLFDVGGGDRAYPLMDVITSDLDDTYRMMEGISARLSRPCGSKQGEPRSGSGTCSTLQRILDHVQHMLRTRMPDEVEEATLAIWLLRLDWLELVTAGSESMPLLQALVDLSYMRGHGDSFVARTSSGIGCDSANTQEDLDYIRSVQNSLAGIETLPLERNEFKWADFFFRRHRDKELCPLGLSTLLLVAGDITACAAGAVGGEHFTRLRRAVVLAQGIARQHVDLLPGQETMAHLDILWTQWPVWALLKSIAKEMDGLSNPPIARVWSMDSFLISSSVYGAHRIINDDLYLSVVVQGRNDDYGGGMLLRLNRMLSTTSLMLHEARIPAEIILVEWNPPSSSDPISEVIERLPGTESVPIRIIRVPPKVHMLQPHHKAHPIFEHIAENVAFRRARGKFILKTNIDNIFSPDTVNFLRHQELREDAVYRATYLEYDSSVPETDGLDPQHFLEWLFQRPKLLTDANQQLVELSKRFPEDTHVCQSVHRVPQDLEHHKVRPFYWAGSGDFVLTSRAFILHVHGYPQVSQNWQTDDLIHCRLRAAGAQQVVLQPPCVTVHQNHRRINRIRSSTRWVVTDSNFEDICKSPFQALPTETGLGDDWGYPTEQFEETTI